jgi:DNA recombination protein RmuC
LLQACPAYAGTLRSAGPVGHAREPTTAHPNGATGDRLPMSELELAYLIGGIAGLLAGNVITVLICRARRKSDLAAAARLHEVEKTALEETRVRIEAQLAATVSDLADARHQLDRGRAAIVQLEAEKAALNRSVERIPALQAELERQDRAHKELGALNLSLEKQLSTLSAELDAEHRQSAEKIALLNDSRERLSSEFRLLADRILEEKSKTFAQRSQMQMTGLIGPLREQLGDFRRRVEDVYDRESRDRAALRSEIGQLKSLNERIGKDALNLTNALKGDVKTMGGWGEVILQRILELSGLEKGRAYETQVSLGSAQGNRYQPDAIVRLPEGRDVVVDAKVSLKAYERYRSCDDESGQAAALKAHLNSVRNHINGLGGKHYEDLEGIRTLDFVLMFVPVEAAFFTALEVDPTLFTAAFEKNVILVSPSTLLVTLRTIHNIWRNADQNENAMEIARQAGGLYDKFVGFIEALEAIGTQLERAREAHRTARDRLFNGKGNLVRRAEQLKTLGIKTNKALPEG